MIKGGYKIIDFKGAELSTTAVEITGIYNQIVDDYNKSIMVSGVIISGELQDDAYAGVQEKTAQDLSKSVELTVYDGVITVTEDDEVSFAFAKGNIELTEDVENIMSNSVMKTSNRTVVGDANEAVSGWAYYGSGSTNIPTSGAFFILTLVHTTIKCQFALNRNLNILYTRTYSSDIWTEWKRATNE